MDLQIIIGSALFIIIYIFITLETFNKTVTVLIGASLFILFKLIGQEKAFEAIDWNVIFLLIGMMIIVGITKRTGLFQYIAIKTAKIAKGEPITILVALTVITAILSAFLDNVTTVLILTPVCILIAVELDVDPIPFVISLAIASNIGGTATLIGDPPNIMIGSAANLDFMSFIVTLAPIVIICLVVFEVIVVLLFRKKLKVTQERRARIMEFNENNSLEDKGLLIKSSIVLGLVILGFLLHSTFHLEPATIAIAGAALLMLLAGKEEVDHFFHEVEWTTIFFFIGLFILVGGLVELGVIAKMANWVLSITEGNVKLTTMSLVWVSGIFSAFVDNIPYVATMIPMVQELGNQIGASNILPVWWALSLGACLGGNGTLIGASANVISAGLAGKSGYKISFMQFTKYGILITLITLALASVYLFLLFFL